MRAGSAMPMGVLRANGGCGGRIGRQAKEKDRRCTPFRPLFRLAGRMDEAPQPAHRARRVGSRIITGPANHRNRHLPRQAPPIAPQVKICQGVASEQPDEAMLRVAPLQPPHRIDGEARSFPPLEVADADRRAHRQPSRRRSAGGERRHVLCPLLERVTGGNQPPDLVQAEGLDGVKADAPMPGVGRVEGAAEEADARHRPPLA